MEETFSNRNDFKLRCVCLVIRHGDRAPLKFLPVDPQSDHWPDGAGSLTRKGKIQALNLGKILRQRYNKFLGDSYISQNVHVRSTGFDRSIMSGQCCLAEMFPPTTEEILVPGLKWQPIPIHTKPWTEDQFCVKVPTIMERPPGGEYKDIKHKKLYGTFKKHQDLMNIVDTIGNCNNSFGLQLYAMDAILIMHENNVKFPCEFQNRIDDLTELNDSAIVHAALYNTEITHPTSHLLQEILENVEKFLTAEESSTKTKTFLYSVQDVHVIALIYALTNEPMTCPFCSCLMMEFYQSIKKPSEFFIQMHFLNDHNKEPLKLTIQSQKEDFCSFKNFKLVAEDYININTINKC